jgi:hypothetical protein
VTTQDLSEHTELMAAVARQEQALMAEEFARTARVYDEAQSRDGALHDLTQGALMRLLNSDPDFAKGLDALARRPDNDPDHSEIAVTPHRDHR